LPIYRNIRIKGGAIDPRPGPVVTLPGSSNTGAYTKTLTFTLSTTTP
jgi:hypothetical protein